MVNRSSVFDKLKDTRDVFRPPTRRSSAPVPFSTSFPVTYLRPKVLSVCALGIHRGDVLTVMNDRDDVKILPWEDSSAQKWQIECSLEGYYRFRNKAHGGTLGVSLYVSHSNPDPAAELLQVWPVGHRERDPRQHSWLTLSGLKFYFMRPSMADTMIVTDQPERSTPLVISYLEFQSFLESRLAL